MVRMKRIYEPAAVEDGYRVLAERLWPRGVSKAAAHLDAWEKGIAPSDSLRRWYGHDPEKSACASIIVFRSAIAASRSCCSSEGSLSPTRAFAAGAPSSGHSSRRNFVVADRSRKGRGISMRCISR